MMSVQEFFYGEAEPVWIINTTAAQVTRHHPQQKPDQYITEHRDFPQPKTPQQNNYQQFASHRDSPLQMGHPYHLLQQSPPSPSLQHEAPQHKHSNISQKNLSHQLIDQDHQYIQHNKKGRQRHQGPLQQIPQQYYHQNNRNAPPQKSSYFRTYQPSAPPMNAHLFNSQQENFSQYARPETQVLRLKVPICCEACEERVVVSLSAMRGVQSVDCELCKEKVTVKGSAAPADILKACKKLFKKSEMWIDRYY